jgi:hypothetical protein
MSPAISGEMPLMAKGRSRVSVSASDGKQVRGRSLPLWLKVGYTAFVAVLVPYYWYAYGPTNFLYYCDVALLMTVVALWWELPLLISMAAVGIVLVQMFWIVDFLAAVVGVEITGMTAYMFNPNLPLFVRALSFFHFWLPLLLLGLLWRVGYDRRAFVGWTILAWGLMLVCYFLMPAPPRAADNPNKPVNINYVYGLSDEQPQTWMPGQVYFLVLLVGMPVVVFWPTHLALQRIFPAASDPPNEIATDEHG